MTASGVWTRPGTAASNLFGFGQRLFVPGWGWVVVDDRIGWGSQLDVWTASCARALRWGRRRLMVTW